MGFANILIIFFSIAVTSVNGDIPSRLFDVRSYGANADARTDNSQAFLKAWTDACLYRGKSGVWVPPGTYLIGSVVFSGPCNGPIAFILKGTLRAPTDSNNLFGEMWIGFRYVNRLTLTGGGYLDGQGPEAWKYNDCKTNSRCNQLPASLRFDFVTNSKIHHLRSINSKNTHINVFACTNLNISQVRLTAPEDSPNTDGIKIGSSDNVRISNSVISTGDDCVSMLSGSRDIDIFRVACGPGHGISIGSLGKDHADDYVKGIKVRNCSFFGTDNGVRIKTWAPSLASLASDITFENIYMDYVRNPIVIDQQYCPNYQCTRDGGSSNVQLENVLFKNIWGISKTQVAVNIKCSGARPCKNVKLVDINLSYMNWRGKAAAFCSNVVGTSHGQQNPGGCL